MPLTTAANRIKSLQTKFPRGAPISASALSDLGISSALTHYYLESGWLERLGRGVFAFPKDTLQLNSCLKFLADRIPGLHVAAKTALAWRGFRHNLSAEEPVWLYGEVSARLPAWLKARFRVSYAKRNLFSPTLPRHFGLSPLPETPNGPLVSEPERALLEMLGEVGLRQAIEEARNVMEGIQSLRPESLQVLLKCCTRVKIVRLCVSWSKELHLPWADDARRAIGKGTRSRSRWTSKLKNGTTLILKP